MTILPLRNSVYHAPLRRGVLLIALALASFALSPTAQAILPPPAPDGGYLGRNTAEGTDALRKQSIGEDNTALGFSALTETTNGNFNTAVGSSALRNNRVGNRNTATGAWALSSAVSRSDTGNDNIALGYRAGQNLTIGNNNIDIGNQGVAGESGTIRIGSSNQTQTFIAGISGAVVTGAAVNVNAAGQLGTAPSSKRFKEDIKPIDKTSEALFALTPVAFRYKREIDPTGRSHFGLVAEDVEKVNPDLVVRDKEGKPYTVRYDQVNAMLLNEFLKEHRKVEEQEASITQLKSTAAKQEATISRLDVTVAKQETTGAQQQKEIKALIATVKEQATQIQKVSAQLEASKPVPQVVNNP